MNKITTEACLGSSSTLVTSFILIFGCPFSSQKPTRGWVGSIFPGKPVASTISFTQTLTLFGALNTILFVYRLSAANVMMPEFDAALRRVCYKKISIDFWLKIYYPVIHEKNWQIPFNKNYHTWLVTAIIAGIPSITSGGWTVSSAT